MNGFDLLNNDAVALILAMARSTDTKRVCKRFYRLHVEKPELSMGVRKVLCGDWCINLTNGTCDWVGRMSPTKLAFRNLSMSGVDPSHTYDTLVAQDGRFALWVSSGRVLHLAQLVPEFRIVGISRLYELTRSVRGLHSLTDFAVVLGRKYAVAWTPSGFVAVFAMPKYEFRKALPRPKTPPALQVVACGGMERSGSLNALLHVELVGSREVLAATCEVEFAMFRLCFLDPATLNPLPVPPAIYKECQGVALAMSFRPTRSDLPMPSDDVFAICAHGVAMTDSILNPLRWEAHNVVFVKFDEDGSMVEAHRVISVPDLDLTLPGTYSSGLSDQVVARDALMLSSSAVVDAQSGKQLMPRFGVAANVSRFDGVHFVSDSHDMQLAGRILIRRSEEKKLLVEFTSARPKQYGSFEFRVTRNEAIVPAGYTDVHSGVEFAVHRGVLYVALDYDEERCFLRAIRLPATGVPPPGRKTLWRTLLPLKRHSTLRWRHKVLATDDKLCLVMYPREPSLLSTCKIVFLWTETGQLASKVIHLTRDGRAPSACAVQ